MAGEKGREKGEEVPGREEVEGMGEGDKTNAQVRAWGGAGEERPGRKEGGEGGIRENRIGGEEGERLEGGRGRDGRRVEVKGE